MSTPPSRPHSTTSAKPPATSPNPPTPPSSSNPNPASNPTPPAPPPRSTKRATRTQLTALSELGEAFSPNAFFSALLKQLYLDQSYIPRSVLVPVDFPDRALLAETLTERTGHRVEILAPQRGDKRSLVDLVCQNAKQSYDQRFRVLQPNQKMIQEALQEALTLEELPKRIECFDISHIQGAETVASMVVWEDGAMKKSDYRKFQIKTVSGVDDFASMREVIQRRYSKLLAENKPSPPSSSSTADWASSAPPTPPSKRSASPSNPSRPSRNAKRSSTSTARRTILSSSTAARPSCT